MVMHLPPTSSEFNSQFLKYASFRIEAEVQRSYCGYFPRNGRIKAMPPEKV